jgi:hypothetical protein
MLLMLLGGNPQGVSYTTTVSDLLCLPIGVVIIPGSSTTDL